MVRRRLKILSGDRLSSARVERLRSDNPERDLLHDLAIGMRVPLPTDFVPNGTQPSAALRSTYLKVDTAVNKMLGSIVEQRLAFLLPKTLAIQCIPNLHLGAAHWTPKKGKCDPYTAYTGHSVYGYRYSHGSDRGRSDLSDLLHDTCCAYL